MFQRCMKLAQPFDASTLAKGLRQAQGLGVARLMEAWQRMGLEKARPFLGDAISPAFGRGGQFGNQGRFQDAVEIQRGFRTLDFLGHPAQFLKGRQRVREALTRHHRGLQPGKGFEEKGVPVLHHGLKPRIGEGAMEVRPGGQNSQDIAQG